MRKRLLVAWVLFLLGLVCIGIVRAEDTYAGRIIQIVYFEPMEDHGKNQPSNTNRYWYGTLVVVTDRGNYLDHSKTYLAGKLVLILKDVPVVMTGDFVYVNSNGELVVSEKGL